MTKATNTKTKTSAPTKRTGSEPKQGSKAAKSRAKKETANAAPEGVRLQVIISRAGLGSRRAAETWISEGDVTVNGKVVTALGSRAIPGVDHIKLRGKLIHGDRRLEYYLFNKPTGCVTTMQDPEKRFCVGDVVRAMNRSVVPVGRLDYASSGLLLLTNDGVLAEKLTHARAGIERTYHAKLSAVPSEVVLERLCRKVFLADGPAHAVRVRKLRSDGNKAWVEIVIAEGRNRQVRRMFEAVGILVEKLRRTKMGPLALGRLAMGDVRRLESDEINQLREVTGRKS